MLIFVLIKYRNSTLVICHWYFRGHLLSNLMKSLGKIYYDILWKVSESAAGISAMFIIVFYDFIKSVRNQNPPTLTHWSAAHVWTFVCQCSNECRTPVCYLDYLNSKLVGIIVYTNTDLVPPILNIFSLNPSGITRQLDQ